MFGRKTAKLTLEPSGPIPSGTVPARIVDWQPLAGNYLAWQLNVQLPSGERVPAWYLTDMSCAPGSRLWALLTCCEIRPPDNLAALEALNLNSLVGKPVKALLASQRLAIAYEGARFLEIAEVQHRISWMHAEAALAAKTQAVSPEPEPAIPEISPRAAALSRLREIAAVDRSRTARNVLQELDQEEAALQRQLGQMAFAEAVA